MDSTDSDKVTLEFQNFDSDFDDRGDSEALAGESGNIILPGGDSSGDSDDNLFGTHERQQAPHQGGAKPFWTIEFYQPYFNVTTSEFFTRMMKVCTFFKADFLQHVAENGADMWGPFWISATMIALLSITSNMGHLFQWGSDRPIEEWANDFTTVSVGAIVISVYTAVIPAVLWAMSKWKNVQVSLLEMLSLYGYAFSLVLPFTVMCLATHDLVRWIAVFVGFLLSATTIFVNLFDAFRKGVTGPDRVPILLGLATFVFVLHMILALFVKLFFYRFGREE